MNLIFGGGLWSIAIITALAFGYARVFRAQRWIYLAIVAVALSVIAGSQLLPENHLFYQSVRGGLVWWFWVGVIAVPVGIYAMFVRWARKKAEDKA